VVAAKVITWMTHLMKTANDAEVKTGDMKNQPSSLRQTRHGDVINVLDTACIPKTMHEKHLDITFVLKAVVNDFDWRMAA